jgi:hypothetical protein
MTSQAWAIVGVATFLAVFGAAALWLRMPVYQWYCRRCKKVVSSGRLHPGRCICGTGALMAYFCKACASWHTSPTTYWHCMDCSSKQVILGVEYQLFNRYWKWRNQDARSI